MQLRKRGIPPSLPQTSVPSLFFPSLRERLELTSVSATHTSSWPGAFRVRARDLLESTLVALMYLLQRHGPR
jgi:hypothetical protein